ncbi:MULTISPECIES: hypothetical protein [Vibrio]|uniref:hypothetical protein n=1 Tax=Vibrio TaxID=662 RepID=UPI0003719D05|nr:MULTISPECIES: hypothetical protein [Vibrio]EGQ8277582.1 hypothetical protein [Vibrio parahaemolyticus]EWS67493.1 hypothetical protein Y702_20390 [Vibrio vulnificus BAA87]EGR2993419.1 hypothetical protein [Vibrio parahaemolyticus]EGR3244983.1 hypothetical protein [Vibrio parahaemolyticus]EJG0618792.1 hypothetical protein [Vibrio parahaemolyticus]
MEKLIEFLIDRKLEEEIYESSITGTFYYRTTSLYAYKVIDSEEIVLLAESSELEELWSNDEKLMAYKLFENEAEYDEFIEECKGGLHYGDFNFTSNVFHELEDVDEDDVNRYIERYDLWKHISD